ncbi:hypothetical protein GCM10010521_17370 [Streptomyces rameus]|uniref:Lipoprotein n=1 Tax=Streptomyces rameus TaxID=68261 RepID=A0ABP6MZX8_9ACTN
MRQTARAAAGVVGAAAAMSLLLGCTGQSDDASARRSAADIQAGAGTDTRTDTKADVRAGAQADTRADTKADVKAVARTGTSRQVLAVAEQLPERDCMRRHGFRFWVVARATARRDFPYLLDDIGWARAHGYGAEQRVALRRAAAIDPNKHYLLSLPPDRRPAVVAALAGPRPEGLTADLPNGIRVTHSDTGCTAEAERRLYGDLPAWFRATRQAIAAALLLLPRVMPSDDSASRAASCSSEEREELPRAYQAKPGAVTGQELCEALNRPDLAQLLGTPAETATAASGTDNTAPLSDGRVAQPEAEVRFDTYTVKISATYDKLSVAQYVKLKETVGEKDIKTVQVLDRPGVFSSDHTLKLTIDLSGDGSAAPVGQGPLARTLSVALDRTDRGGSYGTVWSESGALPDDTVLRDIAEKILPTIPERSA